MFTGSAGDVTAGRVVKATASSVDVQYRSGMRIGQITQTALFCTPQRVPLDGNQEDRIVDVKSRDPARGPGCNGLVSTTSVELSCGSA